MVNTIVSVNNLQTLNDFTVPKKIENQQIPQQVNQTVESEINIDNTLSVDKKMSSQSDPVLQSISFKPPVLIASSNISGLSPADQAKYDNIMANSNYAGREALKGLETKFLMNKDHRGVKILDNLNNLLTKNVQSGVRPQELVSSLLVTMKYPTKIFQGNHGTCGAASAQFIISSSHPAEYTSIVSQLALYGSAKLRDGSKLTAPPRSLAYRDPQLQFNDSKRLITRGDADSVFQSALMNRVNLVGKQYNVENDTSDLMSVAKGDSAAHPFKLADSLKSMSGNSYEVREASLFGTSNPIHKAMGLKGWRPSQDAAMADLKRDVNSRPPKQVIALINGSQHYVTVISALNNRVSYYDSAKNETVDIPEEEFRDKLTATVSKK